MATTKHSPSVVSGEHEFTEVEVRETYERLGLNDPDTRKRLLELAAAAGEQPRIGSWLRADANTGSVQ
jgi:hypothetical protein